MLEAVRASEEVQMTGEELPTGSAREKWWRRAKQTVLTIVPFAVVVGIWEIVTDAHLYAPYLLPSPGATARQVGHLLSNGELLHDTETSLAVLGIGFGIGFAIALPLGVLMARNKVIYWLSDPIVNLLQAIPPLAWTPLIVLWFGITTKTEVVLVVTATLFPVLFNTISGVRSSDAVLSDAARTQGASSVQVIAYVVLPSILPSLLTGVRLSIGYGFRALIAAELIVGTSGLGFMIFQASQYLQSTTVIVGMLSIGVIYVVLDKAILRPLEVRTVERWGTLN